MAQAKYEELGNTRGIEDHDHDLVHELSRRLDCLWRYDQYISNAMEHRELKQFWQNIKSEEQRNIYLLKTLIKKHVRNHCF
jgi:uncharacterized protein YeeX (DUF496 family)